MRALSFSALRCYRGDPEEFYMRYVAAERPPRPPQRNYGAVGGAFDAYVKAELAHELFGDDRFLELFESNVEPQHRDFAHEAGAHCLQAYHRAGAYERLRDVLENADDVYFERGLERELDGVPVRGFPDLTFSFFGVPCVLDWKVKGYCSKYAKSPTQGYWLCEGKSHKRFKPATFPFPRNATPLEEFSDDYAAQLTIYGWLCGVANPVGWIDELVCKPGAEHPTIRVATHRGLVSTDYQAELRAELVALWEKCKTWHDPELEIISAGMAGAPNWFLELTR